MSEEEFIITIIVLVLGAGLIKRWLNQKHELRLSERNLEDELNELGVGGQLQKVDDLEKRIRVLEKLATDKKRSLADEIESL